MRTNLAFVVMLSVPAIAGAADLDPATGQLQTPDAALLWGFDEPQPPNGLEVYQYDINNQRLTRDQVSALLESEGALQGSRALVMGGTASPLLVAATEGLRGRFGGRQVELRLWYRAEGTRPRAFVIWMSGDVDAALAGPNFGGLHDLGVLPLLPSGRATDDGWVELTTGPFDFLLAHRLAPLIFIDDELRIEQPPYTRNVAGRVRIDALEFTDLGPAAAPEATCTLATEDARCGPSALCRLGRCVDAAVVDGPAFAVPRLRDEYLARRVFERRMFTGHRAARRNLDRFEAELDAIVADPQRRFWARFALAVDHLEDGHSSPVAINPVTPIAPGVCLQQSQPDLLPAAPQAVLPMVYRADSQHPLGAALQPGDVLTAIDGMEPESWRAIAQPYLRYSADARGRDFVTTPQLAMVALNKGSGLTFTRCARTDATPCLEDELTTIEVQTATLTASLWHGQIPAWRGNWVPCDARFRRLADASDITQNGHVASETHGDVAILQINATPGNVPGWWPEVQAAFRPAPARMVLDERQGNGGWFTAVHWITNYFFADGEYPADILVPWLSDFEDDEGVRAAMFACSRGVGAPGWGYQVCGGAMVANFGQLNGTHPAPNSAAATRLALLTGVDASGNDWLTYNLRVLRPAGSTRVFGPVPTFGAYGELAGLPMHSVGFSGGAYQMTGGVILGSENDSLTQQLGGVGVEPDEVVYQSQSDAMQGVDTQMNVALQWVREDS